MCLVSIVLLVVLSIILSIYLIKLKRSVLLLKEILELKDATISNLQAQKIEAKKIITYGELASKAQQLHEQGLSKSDISKRLKIDINGVETALKIAELRAKE